jgi:hypothetical protein
MFAKLPKEKEFCIVVEESLKGYCKALGISSEEEQNLFVKFLTCKSNQFTVSSKFKHFHFQLTEVIF